MPPQARTATQATPWARALRSRACSAHVELPRLPACNVQMHRSVRTGTSVHRRVLSARARSAEQRASWGGRSIAIGSGSPKLVRDVRTFASLGARRCPGMASRGHRGTASVLELLRHLHKGRRGQIGVSLWRLGSATADMHCCWCAGKHGSLWSPKGQCSVVVDQHLLRAK